MALEQAKKKRYFFDVVEGVQVPSTVSIRATNQGVDVTIDCPVFEYQESANEKPAKKGEAKAPAIVPVVDVETPLQKFVKTLEVEKKLSIDGEEFTIEAIDGEEVLLSDSAENSITYSMEELFEKVQA